MMNSSNIQVSVCVVTYNQESYIRECLDSLISQQTNFKFEIIVGEDCSTDQTRAIVGQYVKKHPDLIIPLFYNKNIGALENIKQVYLKARGKYIAHIDGDDLALPNKLQRQFDILEQNPKCNICSHDMVRVDAKGVVQQKNWVYPERIYDLFDLYHKLPFFAHSSKMFRNKYDQEFWEHLLSQPDKLDMDIHIENTIDGDIYHLGELLGGYRVNVGISTQGKRVNPILSLGAIRVFEKGLVLFENDPLKLKKIKKLYALAMLQCAYNYAVYDKDPALFKKYVALSLEQEFIGLKQIIFKIATFSPQVFIKLFVLRAQVRDK